jgi:4-hydroxybenzoate polyprenyltransferase
MTVVAIVIDSTLIFLSLITGGIGTVLMVYGKKQGRWPHLVAGIAFIVYPYFADTLALAVGIGVLIAVGLWLLVRQGY